MAACPLCEHDITFRDYWASSRRSSPFFRIVRCRGCKALVTARTSKLSLLVRAAGVMFGVYVFFQMFPEGFFPKNPDVVNPFIGLVALIVCFFLLWSIVEYCFWRWGTVWEAQR